MTICVDRLVSPELQPRSKGWFLLVSGSFSSLGLDQLRLDTIVEASLPLELSLYMETAELKDKGQRVQKQTFFAEG